MNHLKISLGLLCMSAFVGAKTWAAEVTYQGRLLKPNGDPVTSAGVQFRLQVRTPMPTNCLLYEETQTKNLSASKGVFAITLNGGAPNTGPFPLERAMQNRGTFSGFAPGQCDPGHNSYTPGAADGRVLVVTFDDGNGWEDLPSLALNHVPAAIESITVGGFGAGNLHRVVDATGAPFVVAPFTDTQHNALLDLVNGTSAQYLRPASTLDGSKLSPGSVPDASISALAWSKLTGIPAPLTQIGGLSCVDGKILKLASGVWTCADESGAGGGLPTAAGASGKYLKSDGTSWSGEDITFSDVKNSVGGSAFNLAGCAANQTVSWSSLTDMFTCQSIGSLDAAAITSGTIDVARLPAGLSPWQDGGSGRIYYSGGNVGIGTTSPVGRFDVGNDIADSTAGYYVGANIRSTMTTDSVSPVLYGLYSDTAVVSPSTGSDATVTGGYFDTYNVSGISTTQIVSLTGSAANSAGVSTQVVGVIGEARTQASGSATHLIGVRATASANSGTNDNVEGIEISATANSATTNAYGAKISLNGSAVVDNRYAIHLSASGAATNDYGLYQATATQMNYFAGNVGIGTTSPQSKLDVNGILRVPTICDENGANCKTISSGWGSGGSVTSVATGAGLTGGPITTTGTISIAAGGVGATELATNAVTTAKITDGNITTAKIADGNVTGVKLETLAGLSTGTYGSATAIPAVTIDTKGRITAITTNSITGLLPAAGGASGKYLKSDGTNWAGSNVTFPDIKNSVGGSAFNLAGCAANQTVSWSSLTDMFTCQNIGSLDGAAITSGTIAAARLPAGASMWQDGGAGKIYYSGGNVGIGTASPRGLLEVNGTIISKAATSNASSTIDFSVGNIQYTTNDCGGFQFNNMKDGASYAFIVQGTSSTTCIFTAYSDSGSTALTVHMPPDHSATTASKHTIYNMMVAGNHVYVAWTPGY